MVNLGIEGVRLTDLDVHEDNRGFFTELFRSSDGDESYVQSNRSRSEKNVLRGLHFHRRQSDLWHVVVGKALVVLVDLRTRSSAPRTARLTLEGRDPKTLFIPPGVAHGFRALETVELIYWVTHPYDATDEYGIAWDDPSLSIDWGEGMPELSPRDAANENLDWDRVLSS